MRYWLYFRAGEYYIFSQANFGIVNQAIAQGATPVSSIYETNELLAVKLLYLMALAHHKKIKMCMNGK